VYAEVRKHVGKRIDARVASFHLSFSDPKSVSLLAAGSSPEVRGEVQARHVAMRKVLGWLEQEAVGVRRGHNGVDRFHAGIAAGKAAALATRKPKDHSEPEASFYERVASGLAEHGIGPAELEHVCEGGRTQVREYSQVERERLLDRLAGPGGLTAQASTFARRDVLDALAKRLPVAASADRALGALEDLADEFLGSQRAVLVTVDRGLDEPRYSTSGLLRDGPWHRQWPCRADRADSRLGLAPPCPWRWP
jgi:hypothetical protein